ncbi:MAG TPA: hypothetical protein VFU21_05895 [Kofleriaceae bacterium]|nr:hypothetical protein [Kofleriaceae bacterium]
MPRGILVAGGIALAVMGYLVVLVAAITWWLRKRIARRRAAIEGEGVECDSGPCLATARYRKYRARGMYSGGGIRRNPAQLVLTRTHLHLLGVRGAEPVPVAELHRYRATVDDGRLVITTDEPVGATGRLEVRVRVLDPDAWLTALGAAGSPSTPQQ